MYGWEWPSSATQMQAWNSTLQCVLDKYCSTEHCTAITGTFWFCRKSLERRKNFRRIKNVLSHFLPHQGWSAATPSTIHGITVSWCGNASQLPIVVLRFLQVPVILYMQQDRSCKPSTLRCQSPLFLAQLFLSRSVHVCVGEEVRVRSANCTFGCGWILGQYNCSRRLSTEDRGPSKQVQVLQVLQLVQLVQVVAQSTPRTPQPLARGGDRSRSQNSSRRFYWSHFILVHFFFWFWLEACDWQCIDVQVRLYVLLYRCHVHEFTFQELVAFRAFGTYWCRYAYHR
jgi:hypothetical protein